MQLSPLQMQNFYRDGYVVVRNAVPRLMTDAALYAINQSLGYEGLALEDLPKFRAQSYCPNVKSTPVINDLFNKTPLFDLVDSMLGRGNLLPITGGQIALRFPGHGKQNSRTFGGHLDGIGTGSNGIPVGEFRRGFSALVTVLLQDLPEPFAGNFTVWPQTHRVAETFFREATPEALREGMPELDLPCEAVQITGQAGDAVISHHQLIHGAAPNQSPNIRYAAIFRPRHQLTEEVGTDAMTDIWREWEGVRAVVEPQAKTVGSGASAPMNP